MVPVKVIRAKRSRASFVENPANDHAPDTGSKPVNQMTHPDHMAANHTVNNDIMEHLSKDPTIKQRRNEYDVTGTVRVTLVDEVRLAVRRLFISIYPQKSMRQIDQAFELFEALFTGHYQNFKAYDTPYHDMQHTLDMTLTTARMAVGYYHTYRKRRTDAQNIPFEYAKLAVIISLFHDAGYIVQSADRRCLHGAEYTKTHVSRGARFIKNHVVDIIGRRQAEIASRLIHFTGYEQPVKDIHINNPAEYTLGSVVATADLITQMADRCYLEKCRDRLYPEFVLADMTVDKKNKQLLFESAADLLMKTPAFYQRDVRKRINKTFRGVHRYLEALYEGSNPYLDSIQKHIDFVNQHDKLTILPALRRTPPDNHAVRRLSQTYIQQREERSRQIILPS